MTSTNGHDKEAGTAAVRKPGASRRRILRMAGVGGVTTLAAGIPWQATAESETGASVTFGNRIPKSWFWFQGFGATDQGYGKDPFGPFAFDLALRKGGVEDYNVMTYSSVVPKISYGNISTPQVGDDGMIARPDHIDVTPGSVLEAVMSKQAATVPEGQAWTVVTGLGLQWAAEPGSRDTLRNGYVATYIEYYRYAARTGAAERTARVSIATALGHALKLRDLVPYAKDAEPTVFALASQVDNTNGIGPLFATQITGLGCYEYVFPTISSE